MKQTIELANSTYSRLEKLAEGFDTPESVIIRLLDGAEGKSEVKPTLSFRPTNENEFKLKLIQTRQAEVVIYKNDGSREVVRWNANRLSESSNLRGNLWSGFLRGWKNNGINRVELSILPIGSNLPEDDTEQVKSLALELGLTYDEMSQLDYDISDNCSNDGHIYNRIVQFSDDCDKQILAKIEKLHDNLWVNVSNSIFDNE